MWVEVDLVARWQAGPAPFAEGVRRLRELSPIPGVVGFKIADELAYRDGFDTEPEAVTDFLREASSAIRDQAPGKQLLVDLYVPELGCLPGSRHEGAEACRRRSRAKNPALALPVLDRMLAERTVDVVNVSTGLQEEAVYRNWGVSRDLAQRAAWAEMRRRGWHDVVTLQSRKALAAPGGWQGPERDAQRDVTTFVDIPLQEGAGTVDIWTWRQNYRGETVQLLSPGFRPNPLWRELEARRRSGARLMTHFTPSNVEQGVAEDLAVLATVFSDVFMAGGIG